MARIKQFTEIEDEDLPLVGGKGLNLGKLTKAGFSVPPGFCVTTTAYHEAVGALDTVDRESLQTVAMPDQLQAEILDAYENLSGARVAVRSSATAEDLPDASFAGQQDTFLNVSGASAVLQKIRDCWASLWSERAVAYRRDHDIDETGLGIAVVVQVMIDADVSGVMFTMSPSEHDELVIESNWGLGESVVSGEMSPDHFAILRTTNELNRETLVTKRKMITRDGVQNVPSVQQDIASLERAQVTKLARIGMQIEEFYGAPQDVEWAFANDSFYILQARPITTHADSEQLETLCKEEVDVLAEKADEEGTVWSRFNLSEVLPTPLPMTWSIIKTFMSGKGGFGLTYRDLGFSPSPRVDAEGVLDLICGRIYFNLSRDAELYFHGFPLEHNFEKLKRDPQKAIYPQAETNIRRSTPSFWLKLPHYIIKMVAADRKLKQVRNDFDKRLAEEIFPEFQSYVREQQQISLADLSDQQVLDKFQEWRQKTLDEFAKEALKATVFAGFSYQQLEANLRKCFSDEESKNLITSLISGLQGDLTVETNLALWEVAQGKCSLEDFLARYGHRAVGEFELAQPRWREDPTYVEQIIESFRVNPDANPMKHLETQQVKCQEAESQLADAFANKKNPGLRKQIERELDFTQRYMPFRETAKFYLMLGYELIRKALLELDQRYQLDGGIFYLTPDELGNLENDPDQQAARQTIAQRKKRRLQSLRIDVPDVIFSDSLHEIGEPPQIEAKNEMKGFGVSAGVATGKAHVLLDPTHAQIADKDYVLVCPSTDPAWTPLFLHAAALVMERGGMLSHGAVVAREYGIPAVVNVAGATKLLRDGQRVRVDGSRGIVSILDDSKVASRKCC